MIYMCTNFFVSVANVSLLTLACLMKLKGDSATAQTPALPCKSRFTDGRSDSYVWQCVLYLDVQVQWIWIKL